MYKCHSPNTARIAKTIIAVGAFSAAFSCCHAVFAQTAVYTNSADFLAALGPAASNDYTETFTTSTVEVSPSFSFSQNGYSYTVTAPEGAYEGGGLIGANYDDDSVTFTFTSGNVDAVGGDFYFTDINNNVIPGDITLTLDNGTSVTYTTTSSSDYRGFIADSAIESLTIAAPTGGQYASADNLTVANTTTPEPGVWVTGLSMAGMTGVGLVRGRRRKNI